MSSPAQRQAAYRRRQRGGRVVLLIEVDEAAVEALLTRAGLLAPGVEYCRDQLADAVARQLELLCAIED